MKPAPEQVREWWKQASAEFAFTSDEEIRERFAELAAQWGASQAQQTSSSAYQRGYLDGSAKPCTECADYRAMYLKVRDELAALQQAQQPPIEEPELPEPVVAREEYAVGTGEFYTATQMHDHFAAGVRVGMARAQALQDGLPQVISGAVFDFAGYLTTRTNVIEVGSTANASPMADLVKEWAALRGLSLNDAAVLSWQKLLAMTAMQGDNHE